jgi:aminopeptidase YwaD
MSESDVPQLLSLLRRNALHRSGDLLERIEPLDDNDAAAVTRVHFDVERLRIQSVGEFAKTGEPQLEVALAFIDDLKALVGVTDIAEGAADSLIYERNPGVKGPMTAFGYSYVQDKYGSDRYRALALPRYSGAHGSGGEYAYEALNLVDGQRSVSAIRDWLTAELGPVPVAHVSEYLAALESIGVLRRQQ